MSDLIDQILTPEVRMVLYLMLACVVMLYVLSIVYVIRDAQRRGKQGMFHAVFHNSLH